MAKKKTKKAVKSKSNHKPVKKTPRQSALPGMEDRAVKAIDNAANDYYDVVRERIGLTAQETSLKTELLTLMHKHKKTHYKHGAIEITIKPEGEKLKVIVKEENEQLPDDTQPEAEADMQAEADDYLGDAVIEEVEEVEA